MKAMHITLVVLIISITIVVSNISFGAEWLDAPGMSFDIRAAHPRLFFQGQEEWDTFEARITNPANADEYLHYQRMKEYVDTYDYDPKGVGHWTQRFRWHLSRALIARIEGGIYQTEFLNTIQGWVNQGRMYNEAVSFMVSLAFDWFYDEFSQAQREQYIDWIIDDSRAERTTYGGRGSWSSHTFSETFSTVLGTLAIYGESYRSDDIYNELQQADFWYHEFAKHIQLAAGDDGGHFDGSSYFGVHMHSFIFHFWGWSTATTEDHFTTAPYFTKIGEWAYLHHRFVENGSEYMVSQGDGWFGGDHSFMAVMTLLNSMKLSSSQYSMAVIDKIYPAGIQNAGWFGSYGYMNMYYLLFKPDTFPTAVSPANAPLAMRFAGLDHVVWRGGYDVDDSFFFYKHNDKMGGHDHHDAGHFEIARYGRGLAIDSGGYEGGDRSDHDHWGKYYRRTISHNLVTIFDPNEEFECNYYGPTSNDGGQKYYMDNCNRHPKWHDELYEGSVYDRGGIKRYEEASDYNYLFADVTPAYSRGDGSDLAQTNSRKCVNFTRQIVNLKPDYFIVYDRVKSYDASFKKRWLLHFQEEPDIMGSVIGSDAGSGRTDYNGDLVIEDNGQARLFVKSLFPENRIISKRGGLGFEFWTGYEGYGAYNAPPYANISEVRPPNEIGSWRIEVSPSTANTEDIFLHVLYPTDTTTATMPPTNRIAGTTLVGTQVEYWVAMFSKTETTLDEGQFDITGSGVYKTIIADLAPNTNHDVYVDGNILGTYFATDSGLLVFDLPLTGTHSISIGQGPPDTDPPAAITDLTAATGTQPGSVDLAWTATGNNGNVGIASSYIIRYSNSPITEANWDSTTDATGEPPPKPSGSPETFIVTGLIGGQTYYFAIKAKDGAGNSSGVSNSPSAEARVDDIPPVISGITASSVTYETATILWSTDEPADSVVEYGTTTSYGSVSSDAALKTTHSETLTNLLPDTTYHYKVGSTDVSGNTATSGDLTFKTDPEPSITDYFSWWPFNGNADDVTGNNDGTPYGASFVNDAERGQVTSLDGSDDYVDVGSFDIPGNGLTISAWFKADPANGSESRVVSKATSTAEQDHWWMLGFYGNKLRFRLKTGTSPSNGTTTLVANSGTLLAGTWTHIAAVYDGTNMLLYKDGQEVGRASKTGIIAVGSNIPVWIGQNPGNYGPLNGLLDDVMLYDRALEDYEIQALAMQQPEIHGITVAPTSSLTTTEAGGSATFTVKLDSQPAADVTIGIGSSDTGEGTVSPTELTFTNADWGVPQIVTITGVDDSIVDGDIVYTIITQAAISADPNYDGLDATDVSVTNTDDDIDLPTNNDPIFSGSQDNVAFNKGISAIGSSYPGALTTYCNDGIVDGVSMYWAGVGTPNGVIIDLGGDYSIGKVKVNPFGRGQTNLYYYNQAWNVQYAISSSPGAWQDFIGVTKLSGAGTLLSPGISITNGDPGNTVSDALYKYYEFTFDVATARYIRFYVTAGDLDGDSNCDEIEVYTVGGISDQTWDANTQNVNAFDLDDYFSDPDGDLLTYTYTGPTHIAVTVDQNSQVTFNPESNWNGTESVVFTASDGRGGMADSNTITLIVGPVVPGTDEPGKPGKPVHIDNP